MPAACGPMAPRFPRTDNSTFRAQGHSRLFDYFLVVGASKSKLSRCWKQIEVIEGTRAPLGSPKSEANEDDTKKSDHILKPPGEYETIGQKMEALTNSAPPKVLSRCPVWEHDDYPLAQGISAFVFPHDSRIRDENEKEGSPKLFSFVLTSIDGSKQYGASLVFDEMTELDGPKGSKKRVWAPKALVFISHHPYYNQMENLLKLLFRISLCEGYPYDIERVIWLIARDLPVPTQANNRLDFELHKRRIKFEGPCYIERLPLIHSRFGMLFELLSHDHIIAAVMLLLNERKLVLVSESRSVLLHCSEALRALLYPLEWQSVYIPILPAGATNVLLAPVPFFVGLTPALLKDVDEPLMADTALLDIDKGVLELPNPPPVPFPNKFRERLMGALLIHDAQSGKHRARELSAQMLRKRDYAFPMGSEVTRLDQEFEEADEAKNEKMRLLKIRVAFFELIIEILRGYKRYIVPPKDTKDLDQALFKDKAFVRSKPSWLRAFAGALTGTMAFGEFVQTAFASPDNERVMALSEKRVSSNTATVSSFSRLTWGKKTTSDEGVDWEMKAIPTHEEDWFKIKLPTESYFRDTGRKADFRVKDVAKISFPILNKEKFFGKWKTLEFDKAKRMGFAFLSNQVQRVDANSPAEEAGIEVGWQVMSVDNRQAPCDQLGLKNLIVLRRRKHSKAPLKISFASESAIGMASTEYGKAKVLSTPDLDGIVVLRIVSFNCVCYIHNRNIKDIDFKQSMMEKEYMEHNECSEAMGSISEETSSLFESQSTFERRESANSHSKGPQRLNSRGRLKASDMPGDKRGGNRSADPSPKHTLTRQMHAASSIALVRDFKSESSRAKRTPSMLRRFGHALKRTGSDRKLIKTTEKENKDKYKTNKDGEIRQQKKGSRLSTADSTTGLDKLDKLEESKGSKMPKGEELSSEIKEMDSKQKLPVPDRGTQNRSISPGREIEISFGPGKLGICLDGNKVTKVVVHSQAYNKGVRAGMIILSINGRRAINDKQFNFKMIASVREEKNTELVLKFLRPFHERAQTDILKRGKSQENLKIRSFKSMRHSVDTVKFTSMNPYLKYIKSVAAATLKRKHNAGGASKHRTRGFTVSQGKSGVRLTDPSLSLSNNSGLFFDDGFSPITSVGSSTYSEDEFDPDSVSMIEQSGRRVPTASERGWDHDERFIVAHPAGIPLSKSVSENSESLGHIPQGTRLISLGKLGRRVCVKYAGKQGWVSQYRKDALPLMIAITSLEDVPSTASTGNLSPSSKTGPPPSRSQPGSHENSGEASENNSGNVSASNSRRHSIDKGSSSQGASKWVKWLRKKIDKTADLKIGDRIRLKRRTKKLQAGQVGTIAHNDRDEHGNWFVDFISLIDEVERWALPMSLIEIVEERVDEVLIVQFAPDRKVGMAFNENGFVTKVMPGSQALAKGVEVGNRILRVNGVVF